MTGPLNSSVFIPERPTLLSIERKAVWVGMLLLAIGLHVFEGALPGLGPWFKPGLANIMTLLALEILGPGAAFSLAIGRVVIGSFLIGTLLTPTFIISISGSFFAALVMLVFWRVVPGIGFAGISLMGAIAHMVVQFIVVESLFIHQAALYYLLPPLLVLSCITGWLNGSLAAYMLWRMKHQPASDPV